MNVYLFVIILAFTALLPDIDNPRSKVGRKVKLFSKVFNFLFGHRTLTHSIFFMGVISLIIWKLFDGYYIPFVIGYGSHLVLDSVTKQGVNFIYPIKQFRISGFIKTGGLFERVFFWLLVFLVVVVFVRLLL